MARVFVSHASEDTALAGEVHQWLINDDHEVFLDRDLRDGIAVGDEWERRLYERLQWASAMVCLVTSAYVASSWCAAEVGGLRRGASGCCRCWLSREWITPCSAPSSRPT